jgi:hypothetical protein
MALNIHSSVTCTNASFLTKDLLLVLNTLFCGRVFIAHNLLTNRSRLLTSREATEYVTDELPAQFILLGQSEDILRQLTPRMLTTWYEARDETSYIEIRFPRTEEEEIEKSTAITQVKNMYHYTYVTPELTTINRGTWVN